MLLAASVHLNCEINAKWSQEIVLLTKWNWILWLFSSCDFYHLLKY